MGWGSFSINPATPSPGPTSDTFTTFVPLKNLVTDVASIVKAAPIEVVQAAYVRAARQLSGESRWLRYTPSPDSQMAANTRQYNLSFSDANVEIIGIAAAAVQDLASSWHPLKTLSSPNSLDLNAQPNFPAWYAYIDEAQVMFDPIPNLAYTWRVQLIVQVALTATAMPTEFVNKFNRRIEAGALAFLYGMSGESWYNPNEAARFNMEFQEGINQAKAWVNRGFQGGSVRANGRAFLAS